MTEISLSILDLATNSQVAGASEIGISVIIDTDADTLSVTIADDGKGILKEHLKNVTDPFFTTRTTRKVGMGIPLFKMLCEQCEGSLTIESETDKNAKHGVTLNAVLRLSSVDRPPLGDLGGTVTTLIHGYGSIRYVFNYSVNGNGFTFDTDEIKEAVGEDITQNEILTYLNEMINENIESINGGLIL